MLNHHFNLRISHWQLCFISILLSISFICIAILAITVWQKIIGFVGVAAYGAYLYWHEGLRRSANAIIRLQRQADGRWQVTTHTMQYTATLRGDSTVTSLIAVLRFNIENKRRPWSCVVFRDALSADAYRQLMIAARL